MTLLITAIVMIAVFNAVVWLGRIWILGAEITDEQSQ